MVATLGEEDDQVTCEVISSAVPSVNVPVAANCDEVCPAICNFVGAMASVNCEGSATVRFAVRLVEPIFEVICVCPRPWPVATPDGTVATLVNCDVHVAADVTSCVDPSLKVPVAEKLSVPAGTSSALVGEIVKELSVAEVTFTGTAACRCPRLKELKAVMVVDPAASPFTRPFELTVPTPVFDDDHVKNALRSCVVESLKVPIPVS